MENNQNVQPFCKAGDLNKDQNPCYTTSEMSKILAIEKATMGNHCKIALRNYYKTIDGYNFDLPPHPDYVELSAYTSEWIGVTRQTYILPLSDHNKNFYSLDNQQLRLSSRGRKARNPAAKLAKVKRIKKDKVLIVREPKKRGRKPKN